MLLEKWIQYHIAMEEALTTLRHTVRTSYRSPFKPTLDALATIRAIIHDGFTVNGLSMEEIKPSFTRLSYIFKDGKRVTVRCWDKPLEAVKVHYVQEIAVIKLFEHHDPAQVFLQQLALSGVPLNSVINDAVTQSRQAASAILGFIPEGSVATHPWLTFNDHQVKLVYPHPKYGYTTVGKLPVAEYRRAWYFAVTKQLAIPHYAY